VILKMSKTPKLLVLIFIIIAVIVIITAILLIDDDSAKLVSAASHISLAENYILDLNYEAAIAEYRVAIEIDPKNPDHYIALAEVYTLIGDISSAEKVIEEGITAVDDEDKVKLKEINLPTSEPTTSASLSTETIQTAIPAISAEPINTTTTTPQTTATTTTQIYPQDITFTMDSSEYKKLNEFFEPFDYYFDLASLVDEESLVAFAIWRCEVSRDGTFSIPQSDVENVLSEYFDIDKINHSRLQGDNPIPIQTPAYKNGYYGSGGGWGWERMDFNNVSEVLDNGDGTYTVTVDSYCCESEYRDSYNNWHSLELPDNVSEHYTKWNLLPGQRIVDNNYKYDISIYREKKDVAVIIPYRDSWQIISVNGWVIPKTLFEG
jgi:hypothetical protein